MADNGVALQPVAHAAHSTYCSDRTNVGETLRSMVENPSINTWDVPLAKLPGRLAKDAITASQQETGIPVVKHSRTSKVVRRLLVF